MKKTFFIAILLVKSFFVIAQNVGIGTTTPTKAKLEVHGAVDRTAAIFGAEGTGISLQRNYPSVGFNQYFNNGSRFIGNGFAAVQYLDPTNGVMFFDMLGSGTADNYSNTLRRAMLIANEGRVTIGSGDYPPATLYVARGNAVDGTAVFSGTTHRSHFNYSNEENTYIRAGKDGGTVIINDIPNAKVAMGGFVGINTVTPSYPLEIKQVGGKGLMLVDPTYSKNCEAHVYGTGGYLGLLFNGSLKGVFVSTSGEYTAVSDARLKTNIQTLSPLLDKIMKLRPVEYGWKNNPSQQPAAIGFIAQEVKSIFPELVTVMTDSTTGYKNISDLHTLNYSGLGVVAIKAIQEQQQMIDELKQMVSSQQKLIEGLLKRDENVDGSITTKK